MLQSIQSVVAVLAMLSFMAADTASIGTISARGDFRVDSHIVKSNATLFNGSVVETDEATADLRIEKGTAITLSTNSRGTLYDDRLVLTQGKSEFTASQTFHVEANTLRVTTDASNARGIVSLGPGNMVQVAALTGTFSVTNDHGILLAKIGPGHPMGFAFQAGSGSSAFKGMGRVSVVDGKYYLTLSNNGVVYQLVGKNLAGYVGKEVVVHGLISGGATGDATGTIDVKSIHTDVAIAGVSDAVVAGITLGGIAGVAAIVYETTKTQGASR